MADIEKMMTIAEDSRFLSQFQEVLIYGSVWLPRSGPTQLTPYLYLGCKADARDIRNLKHLGITHVVNCAGRSRDNSSLYVNDTDIWVYHALLAEDRDDYDILQHLPEVQMIIKHARDYGGKVLVHCERGINRSSALCVAHVMLEYEVNLMDVFRKLKQLHGVCLLNSGFQRELIHLARHQNLLYPASIDN